MYAEGHGVEQDYAEAVKWYLKAAAQGHEKAKAALEAMKNR
ncbi:MAG: SEL1-like repeat protein [Betaproteobacteria bacterium]|nr:SEL1-like repeat protein [Betaproteobacteria bacterium]